MIESGARQVSRHWEVTEAWLVRFEDRLIDRLGIDWDVLRQLLAAVAGHHGGPGDATPDQWQRMIHRAGAEAEADAAAAMDALIDLWPGATLAGMTVTDARRLSWWLSGLTVAADWIGSNTDWFPPAAPGLDLRAYLEVGRRNAERAVAAAGLDRKPGVRRPAVRFSAAPDASGGARCRAAGRADAGGDRG